MNKPDSEREIVIVVHRTTRDGRKERAEYALPANCERVCVDAEIESCPVWGLTGNSEDGTLRQFSGVFLFRGDGLVFG